MKVLITGAQFSNKGAQSLLYSVISELRARYKNVIIYYIPIDDFRKYTHIQCRFITTYDNKSYVDRKSNIKKYCKRYLKCLFDSFEIAVKYKENGIQKYSDVIKNIDVLIDVSGFALSDKFSVAANYRLLRYVEDAKKYGGKVILMPQSFGPFNYKEHKSEINHKISEVLPKADLIFAREYEGKEFLENIYHLSNVEISLDTVLQVSDIKIESIFVNKGAIEFPILQTKNNVGIIPNEQTIQHSIATNVLKVYEEIIKKLLSLKRNVYIFRHSNDLSLCRKIYEMFKENNNVHIIEDEMDCVEYSEFVKNFDYIIASRYHAIIHAYKVSIPAIILGWAVKYKELAESFDQDQYVFDIGSCDVNDVLRAIDFMDSNFTVERKKINSICANELKNSCFSKCWKILDSIKCD